MYSIGIVAEERLQSIPPKHRQEHEFCFYLHDQVAQMLVQYEASGAPHAVLAAFREAIRGYEDQFEDVEIVSFLRDNNLSEAYEHHITSHVVLALTADMLHFLYEALRCFEKRKFTVGFALLRKPIKEHLLYLSWLLADKDDFIKRFEADNYKTLNNLSKESRIELFDGAIGRLATEELFDAELLWEMIYSKHHENGFEPTCQQATHLITSKGELLRTDDYSFNLVFGSNTDDGYYEFLYSKLPYILLYITQTALALFNQIRAVNELTYSHLVVTSMGCYEALFSDGRSQHIARMLNKELGELLACVHCGEKVRIGKKNAPALYLTENANCKHCGLYTSIPLYWLFGKANVRLTPDNRRERCQKADD